MKKTILTLCLLSTLFAGCRSVRVNVPLDNAKVSDGYINSQTLSLGHVFLWDTEAKTITNINVLTQDILGPEVTQFSGERFRSKQSAVSSATEMTFGGWTPLAPDVKMDVKAAVSKASLVTLENYQLRQFRDAQFALNSPNLHAWRRSLAPTYANERYKFIFISQVILGNEIKISLAQDGTSEIKASVPQIGRANLSVTFDRKAATSIRADNAPLVVSPQVFDLRETHGRVGFERDTETRLNFQALSNNK